MLGRAVVMSLGQQRPLAALRGRLRGPSRQRPAHDHALTHALPLTLTLRTAAPARPCPGGPRAARAQAAPC